MAAGMRNIAAQGGERIQSEQQDINKFEENKQERKFEVVAQKSRNPNERQQVHYMPTTDQVSLGKQLN